MRRTGRTHKVDEPLHRILLRPDALAAIEVVGHGFGWKTAEDKSLSLGKGKVS